RYHAALRDLTRAITLNPKYAAAYHNRADAYLVIGMYKEAADDATQAINLLPPDTPDPDLLLLRARAYSGDKKYNQAVDDLNKLIELKPDLIEAYVERGMVFTQVRRFDDAIGDLTRAIEIANNDPLSLRIRGQIYEALARSDEAIADYRNALVQDPFQTESRDALQRLGQEVPPEEGQPRGPPVSGWVIKEPQPDRYIASNEK